MNYPQSVLCFSMLHIPSGKHYGRLGVRAGSQHPEYLYQSLTKAQVEVPSNRMIRIHITESLFITNPGSFWMIIMYWIRLEKALSARTSIHNKVQEGTAWSISQDYQYQV